MFFNRGGKKDKGRGGEPRFFDELRESVIVLPRAKGKFRNLFPEMVPKPKSPDTPKPEWCIICGKEGGDVL